MSVALNYMVGKPFDKKGEESSLAFGGQALIEGVMIRSRTHMVMCVRKSNNEILTNVEEVHSLCERHRVLAFPFLRGIVALIETLYLGFKGLFFSANVVAEEEGLKLTYKELVAVGALTLGLISFFFVVPFFLTSLFNLTGVIFNIVEAIIRLAIFVVYLILVSRWGEFKRVLQYHGAEHKAINAYEAGVPLDAGNLKNYSRLHPRCGTAFLFITVVVSLVLFSIMPNLGFAVRLAYRLLLIPVIGGISYELLRLSGRYRDSIAMRIFTLPGLAFQRLTTREPSEDMIEVAVKAVEEVSKLSG